MRLYWLAAILLCAAATPALAQGPFVGVALTGDIVRFSHAGSEGVRDASTGGEAIGFALRAISTRAALVYSGGAAFHRTARDIEWSYQGIERLAAAPFILPRELRTETLSYSTRPYAGIEARIGMTRQLELVPAVRLHGLEDGVLVRPAIGLAWSF